MTVLSRIAAQTLPDEVPDFRLAMRQLAGAVSVITIGEGNDRNGLTVTSLSSLSVDPPTILVCVNRTASSWPLFERYGVFGVNVLAESHRAVADRFAGRNGERGPARFEGAEWFTLTTGAPLLVGALTVLDCEVEEMIERHSHSIIIGRVRAVHNTVHAHPLLYWQGKYVERDGSGI